MIDIKNAKKVFMDYVDEYDSSSERIKLKINHILRVVENSKFLAQELNLSEDDVTLAELIGLFHDIGRFEQVRLYDTFSDRDTGLNHAAYSLKVLYEDGLIHRFIDTDEYDYIIKKAVFNHNKIAIEEGLDKRTLLFAKIIRDADKLDIYKTINQEPMTAIFWKKEFGNIDFSDDLMKRFENNKLLEYKYINNNADQVFVFFSYPYDFYFTSSLKKIREEKYLDSFTKRIEQTFENKNVLKTTYKLLQIVNDFMDEEINKLK